MKLPRIKPLSCNHFSSQRIIESFESRAQFFRQKFKPFTMHQASVKETEENWLLEVLPTIHELLFYLTKLNDSIMVYVKKIYKDPDRGSNIYEMSNGSSYTQDGEGHWRIL